MTPSACNCSSKAQGGGNGGGGPSFESGAIDGHGNPPAYVRDVRSAFSGLPKIKPQWLDRYMKILVVGESGESDLYQAVNKKVGAPPCPCLRRHASESVD